MVADTGAYIHLLSLSLLPSSRFFRIPSILLSVVLLTILPYLLPDWDRYGVAHVASHSCIELNQVLISLVLNEKVYDSMFKKILSSGTLNFRYLMISYSLKSTASQHIPTPGGPGQQLFLSSPKAEAES